MEQEVPTSWAVCELDDVLLKMSNGANVTQYEKRVGYPICRIETIWSEGIDLGRVKYIKENDPEFVEKYALQYGDILLSHINSDSHLGKTGLFKKQVETLIHGINILLLRPVENISPDFLNYQLKHLRAKGVFIDAAQRAVNQSSINQKKLKSFRVFIAPLAEQHRIVAKIEELFSDLDKGIENLKAARAQLKVYRQALLKHAFEGKLTAQWRAENQDKLETADALLKRIQQERAQRYQQQLADWEASGKQGSKPKAPKPLPPLTAEELAELPELPEGWGWTRLLETCEAVVDCHNKTAPYQATGIPLVRTPSIRDMKLNFDDSIRYVSQETYEYWSRRCPPLPGDILFTREAPMGEAALIPEGKMVCMGQRIMLLRPGKFLSGKYLLSATQNPIFKRVANKVAVGTGVKHLRVGDVEKLVFPLCSVSEQTEISNQLEACLSEADQLDQTLTTALQQAEALRQSILKKAFAGLLVPQDPHDEPASALLARIQEARAVNKAITQPRRVKIHA
ncbi:MAG: restriction endonuclease subunit S [Thiobacillus sp.]|nr:restriction endonuclease subunit S [Thiobacillus sp.]